MRRNVALVNGESSARNNYFEWLCHIVENNKPYGQLLHLLNTTPFYSFVPNDDNREMEGQNLRAEYEEDERLPSLSLFRNEPCTVLEMLIALSDRLHLATEASRYEKSPGEWFWILIDNLKLCWADDRHFMRDEVVRTIDRVLERTYSSTGEGGLFPLKNPKEDQRDVEIWYQMSAYILENYRI